MKDTISLFEIVKNIFQISSLKPVTASDCVYSAEKLFDEVKDAVDTEFAIDMSGILDRLEFTAHNSWEPRIQLALAYWCCQLMEKYWEENEKKFNNDMLLNLDSKISNSHFKTEPPLELLGKLSPSLLEWYSKRNRVIQNKERITLIQLPNQLWGWIQEPEGGMLLEELCEWLNNEDIHYGEYPPKEYAVNTCDEPCCFYKYIQRNDDKLLVGPYPVVYDANIYPPQRLPCPSVPSLLWLHQWFHYRGFNVDIKDLPLSTPHNPRNKNSVQRRIIIPDTLMIPKITFLVGAGSPFQSIERRFRWQEHEGMDWNNYTADGRWLGASSANKEVIPNDDDGESIE